MKTNINCIPFIFILFFIIQNRPIAQIVSSQKAFFIPSAQDAKRVKLQTINKAQNEILISYFIFEDDPLGLISLEQLVLIKEKNPAIKIKMILDASANGISKYLLQYLMEKGIEIKEFHPMPKLIVPFSDLSIPNFIKAILRLNNRMHDKIILTDKTKMVVGGRNISRKYYGLSKKNFHDLDVYIESKSLGKEISDYFYKLWNSDHCGNIKIYRRYKKGKKHDQAIAKMEGIRNYILNHPDHQHILNTPVLNKERFIPVDSSIFFSSYDEVKDDFIPKSLSKKLFEYASKAQKSVIFVTPYLLPTKQFFRFLKILRERNIHITILTNSMCSTDVMAVAAAYDTKKRSILELGVELYEYQGKDYLHAKAAVIDSSICLVGSYNLDPRSANLNTENVYALQGSEIAESLLAIMKSDLEESVQLHIKDGIILGEEINCSKSFFEKQVYALFSVLSQFRIIYGLL